MGPNTTDAHKMRIRCASMRIAKNRRMANFNSNRTDGIYSICTVGTDQQAAPSIAFAEMALLLLLAQIAALLSSFDSVPSIFTF